MKTLQFVIIALFPLSVFAQNPVSESATTNSTLPPSAISHANLEEDENSTSTSPKATGTETEEIALEAAKAENTALSSAITIFPNPAKSLCTIGVSNKEYSNFSYVVMDQYDYKLTSGQGTSTINVSQLTPGTYTVKVQVGSYTGYKQLIVKGKE